MAATHMVSGVKLTRRTMHFDARPSLTELGLLPRPVEQSLADTVAWFREMRWIRGRPPAGRACPSPAEI
jgi:dihydroflavonol-4-reductase